MTRTKLRTDLRTALWLCAALGATASVHAQPGGEPKPEGDQPVKPADVQLDDTPEPEKKPADAPTKVAPPATPEVEPTEKANQAPAAASKPEPKKDPARPYSPFMDTRLTWTFGDGDLLHKTGEAFPLSPNASAGDRSQYRLFFDNLNSRFSGRENVSHLVLYSHLPGFAEHVDTEAALVMRVNMGELAAQSNNVNRVFEDAGTYLRVFYETGGEPKKPEGLGLTLYPIDTDRFRVGYLYDITWGGTNGRLNQSIFPRLQGSAPGAKLQYDGKGWYVFGGFKTASIIEVQQRIAEGGAGEGSTTDTVRVAETNYGFLGGLGLDATDFLHVDAGGGYFQQGRFEDPDVLGKRVYTFGFSGRLVVHQDMPVPRSADFQLFRNDPNAPLEQFKSEKYEPGKASWALSGEVTQLHQNLKDFDAPGRTDIQLARAGALQANLKYGYLRTSLAVIYRDLPFVLRNQPSFIPFQTLPNNAKTEDETFFAASVDYYIESLRLTPGFGAGLQNPATFRSESFDALGQDTSRTIVVREQGNLAFLPVGEKRVPILQARGSLKWDLSPMMSAIGWMQFRRDNNMTRLELDPSGTVLLRSFISPNFLGYGLAMQARF
ncbi:MAG: hypothetical protein IPI67_18290 [Myxococcales bacterium]|nr:hypothetical protein [Myxococcales bacterium]